MRRRHLWGRASIIGRRLFAALAVVILVASGCGGDDDDAAGTDTSGADAGEVRSVSIEGLVVTGELSAGHQEGELDYESLTPVGGDHNPLWQKCGHYTVEIPAERAVHSLEHGAVWIAHQPGTDVSGLEPVVAGDQWLLMSPVAGLETAIVVSAWGAQVAVDGPDDPRIGAFIDRFLRQGPEDAPCVRGGVGEPPSDPGPGLDV